MILRFHPRLKMIEEAFRERNVKLLKKKWNRFADDIIDALDAVEASETLADLSHMMWLYPHQLHRDKKHKYERYSLSPSGRTNGPRITLVCYSEDWTQIIEEIDYSVETVMIEEVSYHYGD